LDEHLAIIFLRAKEPSGGEMETVTLDLDPPFDASEKTFLRIEVERSSQSVGGGEAQRSDE